MTTTESADACADALLRQFVGYTFTTATVRIALAMAYTQGRRDQLLDSMRDFTADLKRDADATVARS